MTLLIGALTLGLLLGILALGVYVSYRIFDIPDLTAEGSITLGGAVAAALLVGGQGPLVATLAAVLAGMAAGAVAGVLGTKLKINKLLAGIIMMTALYSVNLHVMGRSNVPLLREATVASEVGNLGTRLLGGATRIDIAGWEVASRDLALLVASFLIVALVALALFVFLKTEIGTALRATGDNPQMIRALGVSVDGANIFGLALSNGLIALSGALVAQYQGFADVQMGIGIIVLGLASVIIGEALIGVRSVGLLLVAAVLGSILFRLLVAIALRWGMNPNDLKLITALFVVAALVAPQMLQRFRRANSAR